MHIIEIKKNLVFIPHKIADLRVGQLGDICPRSHSIYSMNYID